jgi:hypothetical protein
MNAVGVELEQEAINDTAEVLSKTGWTPGVHAGNGYSITKSGKAQQDNLFTYLRLIRHAPGAVLWEKKWTKGVPSHYQAASEYLKQYTGYSFPILKPINESRVVRTLTTALRYNLDKENRVAGLKIKTYTGYILSTLVWNYVLKSEIKNISAHFSLELNEEKFNRLAEITQIEIPANSASCKDVITSLQERLLINEKEACVLLLALATSHSPAQINDAVIETVLKHIKSSGIVEIIVWLSVFNC